jgi:hypothetical protein
MDDIFNGLPVSYLCCDVVDAGCTYRGGPACEKDRSLCLEVVKY